MNLFKSAASIAETLAITTETVLKSSANSISAGAEVVESMSKVAVDARKQTHADRVLLAMDTFYAESAKEFADNLKNKSKAEERLGCSLKQHIAKLRKQYDASATDEE